MSEDSSAGRYVGNAWTRPVTELVVETDSDEVTFTASDERDDATVTLPRTEVERLHAQLGTWLAQLKPTAVEGKVWLYTSPAADGAQVLVRFHDGGWQTAETVVPHRWYRDDAGLLEWPGIFRELEGVDDEQPDDSDEIELCPSCDRHAEFDCNCAYETADGGGEG